MLTILGALKDEIKLIKSEMEVDKAIHIRPFSFFVGKYEGKEICLVQTGVGKGAIATAMDYTLEHLNPTLFINIGYAGGLDPTLGVGDLIIATTVINERDETHFDIEKEWIEKAKKVAGKAELKHQTGKLVTVKKSVDDPHQKAFLGTRFEAAAVDMESSAMAKKATEHKIPFMVVRSILDPLDMELPSIPEEAVVGGDIQVGRLLNHMKKSPKDLFKLPKFSYIASQARMAMTNFVKEWVHHE